MYYITVPVSLESRNSTTECLCFRVSHKIAVKLGMCFHLNERLSGGVQNNYHVIPAARGWVQGTGTVDENNLKGAKKHVLMTPA